MESYHFVGVITVVAVSIYYWFVIIQISRMEDKINKLLKAQTEPKKPKKKKKKYIFPAKRKCGNCRQRLQS